MISLIMATVGRSDDVSRMIESLATQTDRSIELIIVDQNQDDRLLPHIARGRSLGIDIIHERHSPPNLSGARNHGIRCAKGEVLAFPDDDCWYEPEVIKVIRRRFNDTVEIQAIVAQWVEHVKAGASGRESFELSLDDWRRFRGGQANSNTLFFRKEWFDKLGGFDERLGVGQWYGAAEETDFVLRALNGGVKILYCPTAQVHHPYNAERTQNLMENCHKARLRARGTGAIYAKHRISFYVIIRGLIAPLVVPLFRLRKMADILRGVFTSIGRLEGYLKWRIYEK